MDHSSLHLAILNGRKDSVKDKAPAPLPSGYIGTAIRDYHFEVGNTNGITLYAKDNVQYVNIVNAPGDRYVLAVKIRGTVECLLDTTFSKFEEAVWDAMRIASNRLPDKPAEINYMFNSCKLEHLNYDYKEHVVIWKGELAELDAISNELCTKLKDGTDVLGNRVLY